jgi:glycosyltransferase 2 family protein
MPDLVYLALSTAGLGLSLVAARRGTVSHLETRVFRAINELPDEVLPFVWPIMQAGTIGAVPTSATMAALAGRRHLAVRMVLSGTTSYVVAKGIKRLVRRGRPDSLLDRVIVRGKTQTGHGYLSGHAAVSAALASAAHAALPRMPGRAAVAAAAVVAFGRVYVGAHLPLDVLGGAAFGWTVDAAAARFL